ncbi:transglycosylase SLT domain-containing protein [Microbacterium sp. KSW2-29]|uniref:Transglycosylase SLT domain-containing protein n=1 Tax=Microbacterium phycohabitans TaxID=3075993 RepID=A0ABU3SMY8_9MICO|nr:transglycosylase SLT domain-containing protein [Microbacterium sp. KSW2-29]MDU0346158.1 transglycosylase SLT domain-containing protein [Microbacterium sp. KSW2-29]
MTAGSELSRRSSDRVARRGVGSVDVIPPALPRRSAPRWSRRRGVVGVFGACAAVLFAAAYVGPMGAALSPAQAEEPHTVTLYAEGLDDAQAVSTSGEKQAPDLQRSSYNVYVKPKPTPTPTPTQTRSRDSGSSAGESGSSGGGGPLYYSGGGAPAEWMAAAGISDADMGYVDYIVSRESGWNPNATNRSSGACGLVQALPCSKVPGNGYDPVDNLRWATGYATGRYGSWAGAYAFWTSNHWW